MKDLFAFMRRHKVTTFVMLLLVLFLAFCMSVAIPAYKRWRVDSIMTEGAVGACIIRNQMRMYMSSQGNYGGSSFSPWLNNLLIGRTDLEGTYFAQADYSLSVVTTTQYMVRVGPPSKIKGCERLYYTLDQDGVEHGPYYSRFSAEELLLETTVEVKNSYVPHPVPNDVVRKLPGLVHELKPGATREQVFRQLGLWEYQDDFRNPGKTLQRYDSSYWEAGLLQQERLLFLAFETTGDGIGGFNGAMLYGSSWTAAEKEMSKPFPNLPYVMGDTKDRLDWRKW